VILEQTYDGATVLSRAYFSHKLAKAAEARLWKRYWATTGSVYGVYPVILKETEAK